MTLSHLPFDFPGDSFKEDLCLFFRTLELHDSALQEKSAVYQTDKTLVADPRLVGFLRDMAYAIMHDGKEVTFIRIIDESPTPFQRYMVHSFDVPAEALGARCVYMERGNFQTLLHNECGNHPVDYDFHMLDKKQLVLHGTDNQPDEREQTLYALVRQNVLIDGFDLDALLTAHPDL